MIVENDTFWSTEDLAKIAKEVIDRCGHKDIVKSNDILTFITMKRTSKSFAGIWWIRNCVNENAPAVLRVIEVKTPDKAPIGLPVEQLVIQSGLTAEGIAELAAVISSSFENKGWVQSGKIEEMRSHQWLFSLPLRKVNKKNSAVRFRRYKIGAIRNEMEYQRDKVEKFIAAKTRLIEKMSKDIDRLPKRDSSVRI